MGQVREELKERYEELKTLRDEVRVRGHLASAEIREELAELDDKWEHFKAKAEGLGKTAGESAEDVGAALRLVGDELKSAYKRIRQSL
jgi:seryl-tRNA synthetase